MLIVKEGYWCLMSYEEASHPPTPVLSHPEQITIKSEEYFTLDINPRKSD